MSNNDWKPSWRDRLAWRLANTSLRIATKGYRDRIQGSTIYGMNACARDVKEDREPPPSWQTHT